MKKKPWLVLKFGGTSVSGLTQWKTILSIVKQYLQAGNKVFIVHSALATVSNALLRILDEALTDNYEQRLAEIKNKHYALMDELALESQLLDNLFFELEKKLKGIALLGEVTDRTHAEVMSYGELMSTTIGAAYLQRKMKRSVRWLDARQWLQATQDSNKSYLQANCNYDYDNELVNAISLDDVVLTQGFIAENNKEKTVLLGRGGSDVSAAYFATKISAAECLIWTDVPGMFTANPNSIPSARLIHRLSYVEAQEIAAMGAKVLHPKCLLPVRDHQIPLRIKSTLQPEAEGTLIEVFSSDLQGVCAVTTRKDITLVSMETIDMWQQAGFLARSFAEFSALGVSIDLVSTSEAVVTVSIDPAQNAITNDLLEELRQRLAKFCHVKIIQNCAAISVIGQKVSGILSQIAPSLEVFETNNVYLLSQAANDLNITLVVGGEQADKLASSLHEYLIGSQRDSSQFGPTATSLQEAALRDEKMLEDLNQSFTHQAWWSQQADDLLAVCPENESVYVYNLDTVKKKAQQLDSLAAIDKHFYAVKANHNPDVLQTLHSAGVGFECVSLAEVEYILQLFPNLPRSSIMYTPNFATRHEYAEGLKLGTNFTVDSTYPLLHWPELFAGKNIFLRIDPKTGKGHHAYVRTAGKRSKFGIPIEELEMLAQHCEKQDINVTGFHAHAGSGILQSGHWREHADLLNQCREWFPNVSILDLGGGFGIQDKFHQSALDFSAIDKSLIDFQNQFPDLKLWLEPGRFYVAESGVLLSRVTQVKSKQDQVFVGINTGMNSLLRPALYGAYHRIVNLSCLQNKTELTATVVGPICESSDVLGRNVPLPKTSEGDVILIANAGAYGQVMSSSYNMREPAGEIII